MARATRASQRATWNALWKRALDSPVIGLDQTSWKRIDDKSNKPWQMWCVTAPKLVAHRIRSDKGAKTFEELLAGFEGTIVCDAAQTHGAGARALGGIVLAGCWAHVYRKYEAAVPDHPEASFAMQWIGALYEIDDAARDDRDALSELRRTKSRAVLDDLRTWLLAQPTLRSTSIGTRSATRSTTGIGSASSSPILVSRSTTTRPSARSAVPSSGAETTSAPKRRSAPRSPRSSTRSSRPRSSPESTRPRTCSRPRVPTPAAKSSSPEISRPRSSARDARHDGSRRDVTVHPSCAT